MKEPLVSILIPFKNTEDYLRECINAIKNQTYQNWEVLAVDDHSEDKSRSILLDYAQKDQRIKVFKNPGTGIIEALRMAYSQSKGQLITRMDADDVMALQKIAVMVTALLGHGKGHVSIGLVKYFSDSGIRNGYARYEKWLNGLTLKGSNYTGIYKECVIPSPCWMVFRDDFDACGAFQPDRYPEDYDLAFRFREGELKCIGYPEILHYWRDYATRTSRTNVHYAQNYFLELKLHYFLRQDNDNQRDLVLWGAGNKGKAIAKALLAAQLKFTWVCDNEKKIGKAIYGMQMRHYTHLEKMHKPQSIVTVANDEAQEEIRFYLEGARQTPMEDYFFFC